jgi:hypothetical protein
MSRGELSGARKDNAGVGVAPFAFTFIGDMPYTPAKEAPFARLVAEVNRDNDVDFVIHRLKAPLPSSLKMSCSSGKA